MIIRATECLDGLSRVRTTSQLKEYAEELLSKYGDVAWGTDYDGSDYVVVEREQTEEEILVEKAVARLTSELYRCEDVNKHLDAVEEIGRDKYRLLIDKLNSKI